MSYSPADFEAMFRKHWSRVFSLCVRYSGDPVVSKDLTQDIFMSLWYRQKTFTEEDEVTAYLTKAAKYRVIAFLRGEVKGCSYDDTLDGDAVRSDETPESELLYEELSGHFSALISGLPEPGKTIFLLSRKEDMSYKEIACIQGISVKTVEYHISRVLQLLRHSLKIWN